VRRRHAVQASVLHELDEPLVLARDAGELVKSHGARVAPTSLCEDVVATEEQKVPCLVRNLWVRATVLADGVYELVLVQLAVAVGVKGSKCQR